MTAPGPPIDAGRAGIEPGAPPALHEYLSVLVRRKWIVILTLAVVPALSLAATVGQRPVYEGTAEVLLGHLDLAAGLTGISDSNANQPERVAETQSGLARVPAVAERTLRAVGLHHRTVKQFLKSSSVDAQANSDLLEFRARDHDPELASRLASAYAREYTQYRLELDTGAIERARLDLEKRIAALKAAKSDNGALYASLVANAEKLRTMAALLAANAAVVRSEEAPTKISPQPKRTALLALALALVLGTGLAFAADAVDTRVRLVDEVARRLGLPLLARLPARRAPQRRTPLLVSEAPAQAPVPAPRLVMLDDPTGIDAEGYRVLRANVDFVNAEQRARSIMVTSALEGEGKSETVANLALAFARSGRRVAVVDLDLRRPRLHRLFEVPRDTGIADVEAGAVALQQALVRVPLERGSDEARPVFGNGRPDGGTLDVLPAGSVLPDAGEFVGTQALGRILRSLRHQADLILVDSPALLRVGDAMALSTHVDALLVVVRMNSIRRPVLKELRRVLDACPTPKLGFVVTNAESDLGYGYSGLEARERRRPRRSLPQRIRAAAESLGVTGWT